MLLRRSNVVRRERDPSTLPIALTTAVLVLVAGILVAWFNPVSIGAVIALGIAAGVQRVWLALRWRQAWYDLIIYLVLVYGATVIVGLVWLLLL